ncbi:hypothetical protein oki1106_02280 [Helicobacter pylori]
MNKAFIFEQNKNLYSIKIRLKPNKNGVLQIFIGFYKLIATKLFVGFVKNTLSLFAFHSIFV